jgi:hypothetical protein
MILNLLEVHSNYMSALVIYILGVRKFMQGCVKLPKGA